MSSSPVDVDAMNTSLTMLPRVVGGSAAVPAAVIQMATVLPLAEPARAST